VSEKLLVQLPEGHHDTTTLGKLLTLMCLCHQAISFGKWRFSATKAIAAEAESNIINMIITSNVTSIIKVENTNAHLFAGTWHHLMSVITTFYYFAIIFHRW